MKNKKLILIISIAVAVLGFLEFFYFFGTQKENNTQPQTSLSLKLLNSHSAPQTGEQWVVSFETTGEGNLTITPEDTDTINDLDFVSLTCNGEKETASQILNGDVIFYSDWQCAGTGELSHLVNIARKHTLEFQFGNQMAYAYNNPDSVTDTFTNTSKIAVTSSVAVTGGQVKLLKTNGTACSSVGECNSGYCVDGYCCNTACSGSCDQCNVTNFLGTCTDVSSACVGTDAACYCSGGNCTACAACKGCASNSCSVNRTTNWGAGTYGCGSANDDKRCYNGTCHDCSDTSGYFYSDGCNGCSGIADSSYRVCWRAGDIIASADSACTSYGGCVAQNWNDTATCVVAQYYSGCSTCSSYATSSAPMTVVDLYSNTCYYRSTVNQLCNQTPPGLGISTYRLVVCQW